MPLLQNPAEILAANLRRQMMARGWSQTKLASVSGVKQPNLSRILGSLDDVRIGTVDKIAKALGCSMAELLMPVDENSQQTA